LNVAETERLLIRRLDAGDSAFILGLVNEPSWVRYIGDKGVHTLQDAQRHIENGPVPMYARVGFGLYAVEAKDSHELVGICGLIRREALDDVDLGFAFLPMYWGRGYAYEAASAVMSYGRQVLGLRRIVAILSRDNDRSRHLVEKLAFRFERPVKLAADDEALDLYASTA
jgi:RimJ/RimL family protein N-acetyltransferase